MRPKIVPSVGRLERWIIHGNCLVGKLYDNSKWPAGTKWKSDAIRFHDPINFEAETLDGKYKLGEPGTAQEYSDLSPEKKLIY